ncbi:MAG: hypothetical protein HRU18_06910 [Pseudoalteromonas sp.]|uniref:hypothetical protein n=1 Tax=Pseudoalteromonas sp. TaxID=53249 RepID=UPI001DAAC364|nr:hypothetical protein [Pseudoalteromonas sp.]NRA77921.1 hypothetical protein [Pseudoalteromonas sp.]
MKIVRIGVALINEHTTADFTPNGMAVLIPETQGNVERIRYKLAIAAEFMAMVSADVAHLKSVEIIDGEAMGEIDYELKSFIVKQSRAINYLSNSSTMRSDLKEFYEFDKMELL